MKDGLHSQWHNKLVFNFLIVSSFIVIAFLSCFLILRTHSLFGAYDIQFHVKRLLELAQDIRHGQWFPQFGFNEFQGALTPSMYPSLNLYLILLIAHLIKYKVMAIYIFYIISVFLGLVISFYSSYGTCQNRMTSYLFALIYNLSGYFFAFCFDNLDIGTVSAYLFLPLVLFGLINFLKRGRWLELSTGMSLLVLSHVVSTSVMIFMLVILVLMNVGHLTKIHFKNLIKAGVATIGVTSIFWWPVMVIIFKNRDGITTPGPNAGGFNFNFFSQSFNPYPNYVGISAFALVAIILSIFYFHQFDRILKQLDITAILVLLFCSELIPWQFIIHSVPFFDKIQGPNRFYIFPQLILTFIFSLIVTKYIKQPRKALLVFALLAIIFQFQGQSMLMTNLNRDPVLTHQYIRRHPVDVASGVQHYRLNQNSQLGLLANWRSYKSDYLPASLTNRKAASNSFHNYKVQAQGDHGHLSHIGYNRFMFKTHHSLSQVKLPLALYHGEHIKVLDNGQPQKILDSHGQIMLSHLSKGRQLIRIVPLSPISSIVFELLLLIIGLWLYLFGIIKKFVS